ncbi:hypothetical protein GW930_02720 [Candidatus Saccharibacteria bacterium]|nr:hypothetical protein [Candidatus Saccharibacteria bacterium]
MPSTDAAIRKRAQIAKTNRVMFLWIAVSSAVIGVCIVVSIFLAQRLFYNEAVLAKKQETVTTLIKNLAAVDGLKQEIRKLDANAALLAARAKDDDRAVRVVLDALPSEANSLALGASLQNRLLSGVDGLTLQTLQVDPVAGVEVIDTSGMTSGAVSSDGFSQISFSFTISGNQASLKKALENLERSIRTIEVLSLRIDGQSNGVQEMSVQGRAFYEPARTLEFSEVKV